MKSLIIFPQTLSLINLFSIVDRDPPWMNDLLKGKSNGKMKYRKPILKMGKHKITTLNFSKEYLLSPVLL